MRKALFLAVIALPHVMPDAGASAVQDTLAIKSIVVMGQREINTEAAVFVNYMFQPCIPGACALRPLLIRVIQDTFDKY